MRESKIEDDPVDRYADLLGVDPRLVEARFNAVLPIARRLAQVISGRFDMRERDIEAYLVKRVKALGGEVRKVKWIGRRGAPDRLVMLEDQWFRLSPTTWVELKAPGVKPEPHQLREHQRMRAMGQTVVVIDSIEGVDAWLGA